MHEAIPQLLHDTEHFANHFADMSNLARELNLNFVDTLENEANAMLMNQFHKNIHEQSLFAACTAASHLQFLHMHVDAQNAKQDGHNAQMVASAIFVGKENKTKRVFFAVYGRECCNNYMDRDWQSNDLTDRLSSVLNKLPSWRKTIDPVNRPVGGKTIGDLTIYPVNMDKHSLISFLSECIFRLEEKQGHQFGYYRTIELCLAAGWLSAHDQFYEVLVKKWAVNGVPDGNLAIAYLKEVNSLDDKRPRTIIRSPYKMKVSEGDGYTPGLVRTERSPPWRGVVGDTGW